MNQRHQEPGGTRPGTRQDHANPYSMFVSEPYSDGTQEPGGTRPGTRQNVRLVANSCDPRLQEPGGTRPGTRQNHVDPYVIHAVGGRTRTSNIILFKRAGWGPEGPRGDA